ncbi:MAG: protein kinase [candidate division Zixibacteria bacterium]|nr:protein kinase [candidate division Zixibacteria bacterium]MDD5426671.1 protein kinase [candidate division Zixibacteria bacterium]
MTEIVQDKRKEVRIGDYILTGKIGQGGIAEIYKGRQESLNRDVAIKILASKLTSDPEIVRRFERESMVIAKLNHPNIVHVIDKGKAGNRYYFVMEYVDGTSLREVIEHGTIPLETKLDMIVQVCKALDYAHKNGVIHRDIKPTNILIDRQGNPRVADFGIAQIVGTPEGEVTSSDVIMGTLAYMSPEQKVSSTNVDQTTDIYAMGIILYEILTGKKPMGRFKMPSELNENINITFDDIVIRCLAQEPTERYQTAVDLKNDILNAMNKSNNSRSTEDYSLSGSESFIGKCRYLDTIKETKFSSTILVENKVNKRLYIIKKHSKGEAGRKEAKLLSTLKHRNIINIFGSGGDNKSTVVISEYAPGGSLADRMVRKYEWHKAADIILQVALGLDFAHKNNIVHGNLRPSNILFDVEENVKLSDFGMPIHYDAPQKKNWYSPPERKISRQGDIYGMGVIFHQLVTGRNPQYDAGDNLLLDDVRMDLPEDVATMLNKLLAIRVPFRYKTCEEFLLDWDDFESRRKRANAQAHIPATPVSSTRKLPLWAYLLFGAGLIIVVAVVLYFTGTFK